MTSWTDRELAAERAMHDLGVQRYRAKVDLARARGMGSYSRPANHAVREHLARMVRAVKVWVREQRKAASRGGKPHPALEALSSARAKQACLMTLRTCFDLVAAGRPYAGLVTELGHRVDTERRAWALSRKHPVEWRLIRKAGQASRRTFRTRLREASAKYGIPAWSRRECAQVGMVLVYLAEEATGLVRTVRRHVHRRTRYQVEVAPEVSEWVDRSHAAFEGMEPLYLPMVDVPAPWGPGQSGGYATDMLRRQDLVKARSRKTLAAVDGSDMPAVYRTVNALQSTQWELDPVVLEAARELWAEGTSRSLPSPTDEPVPKYDPDASKEERAARGRARDRNAVRRGARLELSRVLWAANHLADRGDSLYFPQQLDFRGRIYPVPAFLHPQGGDLARGLLRFKRGCYVHAGTPAERALLVHGANTAGHDKLPLDERVAWARSKRDLVLAVARDPLAVRAWEDVAEPWQFLAWCLDAAPLFETGVAHSRVPCYVDGSNNGLQILSLLLRDPAGAAATNCLPGGVYRDVYQDVADVVTRELERSENVHAARWLRFCGGRVPRAATKRAVMTLPYGCTEWSARTYVHDWVESVVLDTGAIPPWPSSIRRWPSLMFFTSTLWGAIRQTVGPAMALMDWLRDVADLTVEAGTAPQWVAPSGFTVRQGYTNYTVSSVRTALGDRVRYVKLREDGQRLSRKRHRQGLPPNFVHSLDAAVLALAVDAATGSGMVTQVSTIHDSFGAPATEVGALAAAVRRAYADVFTEDLLENLRFQLASQVGGRYSIPPPPQPGSLDPRVVAHSTYLFS